MAPQNSVTGSVPPRARRQRSASGIGYPAVSDADRHGTMGVYNWEIGHHICCFISQQVLGITSYSPLGTRAAPIWLSQEKP